MAPVSDNATHDAGGGLVKTVRYEEATTGTPPVVSTAQNRSSVIQPREAALRPKTAPSARSNTRTSHFSDDLKRDSGFAGSTTSQLSPTLPPTPSLPAYVEGGATGADAGAGAGAAAPSTAAPVVAAYGGESQADTTSSERRRRASFVRRKSKKGSRARPRSISPADLKRLSSFKGLQTDIPTAELDDLDADNFGFSHRGSIFFGGSQMSAFFQPSNKEHPATRAVQTPIINTPDEPVFDEEPVIPSTPSRLVSGRRKPSVQMLQAAIAGGRVLSAEEITFSMKVRSMYEAGDESGADWSVPSIVTGKDTPDISKTQASTESGNTEQANDISANSSARQKTHSSRLSQDIRASYLTKSEHELAGGIEDWQNIGGGDVDRYGFIVPRREGDPSTSGTNSRDGLHRVATGLRIAADQPRKRGLRRSPSYVRSLRSVPPQKPSSLHSATSAAASSVKSRNTAFRSRNRRIRDAAGDMLTLPPGLADIAEQHQDESQVVNALRRREWSRNEKWQKMARPIPADVQGRSGGGMHFDFDTNDPKLINRTWKGIPDRWRATAWHSFLSASAKRRGKFESDESLMETFHQLQDMNCADDYQIDVDVPRTISMHVMFRRRYRGGQRLLFRVLHAIAVHFPETGYVQGMASLAATFLCYFDEEHAFVMMVRLWQLRGLEQFFQPGFSGLMSALKELEDQWLAGSDVAQKLNELVIASTAYGTRWYLTLFNMSIPFPAQLRVWDVFMLLGDASPIGNGVFGGADLDVLHATSTALIDATREIILDSDFENAMKVLTSFIPIRDEDLLMRVARAEWKMGKKRIASMPNITTTSV